jgi:hypothetical protein
MQLPVTLKFQCQRLDTAKLTFGQMLTRIRQVFAIEIPSRGYRSILTHSRILLRNNAIGNFPCSPPPLESDN